MSIVYFIKISTCFYDKAQNCQWQIKVSVNFPIYSNIGTHTDNFIQCQK